MITTYQYIREEQRRLFFLTRKMNLFFINNIDIDLTRKCIRIAISVITTTKYYEKFSSGIKNKISTVFTLLELYLSYLEKVKKIGSSQNLPR